MQLRYKGVSPLRAIAVTSAITLAAFTFPVAGAAAAQATPSTTTTTSTTHAMKSPYASLAL